MELQTTTDRDKGSLISLAWLMSWLTLLFTIMFYMLDITNFPEELWHPESGAFNFQYLLSSSLCLLPHLPIPSLCLSVTHFRRQFLQNLWPSHLAFLCFVVCRMFLSSLSLGSTPSLFKQLVQLMQRLCSVEWDWRVIMNAE